MRNCSVDRLTPSRAAAPLGPAMTQFVLLERGDDVAAVRGLQGLIGRLDAAGRVRS